VTVEEPSTASKGDFDRLLKRNFGKLRRLRECKRSENSLAVPASFAEKLRLNIGQPGIIGPSITADCERVAAAIVSAVINSPRTPFRAFRRRRSFAGGRTCLMIAPIGAKMKPLGIATQQRVASASHFFYICADGTEWECRLKVDAKE